MKDSHMSAVIAACHRINKKGGTPSIGLIKTKLSRPVPLPMIIKGLQYWQANPDAGEDASLQETALSDTNTNTAELTSTDIQALYQRISALESALTSLQTEVRALKQQ